MHSNRFEKSEPIHSTRIDPLNLNPPNPSYSENIQPSPVGQPFDGP
jgi:hypothetical protein